MAARSSAVPAAAAGAAAWALLWTCATAQVEWFDVMLFRQPAQCERMQCLSVRKTNCRDHLLGFYLREKGCDSGQICSNCEHGNSTVPAICYCENPPYSQPVTYGQSCGMGFECTEGECFRPCHTFLHSVSCPQTYCIWDSYTGMCADKTTEGDMMSWVTAQDGAERPALEEGQDIVDDTQPDVFPMSFEYFRQSALGYRIGGILINNITSLESIFLELDANVDGNLMQDEYARLPQVLDGIQNGPAISAIARLRRVEEEMEEMGRRLSVNASITPEICNSKRPRQYYCSFDVSCKIDCRECGWKSATDTAFAACVRPTPETCYADSGKVYCESDQLCHPPGDCSNCVDRPMVDHALHKCLQIWWDPKPLTAMKDWVCRFRNKVGMPCKADQDCIYGLRRCLGGTCASFQPYNPNMTCVSDYDCPHLGFYCPRDPTGGANKYWVQYCREQGDVMMTCSADRECKPDLRCNTAEAPPRCRRLFSLPLGTLAKDDTLCEFGWRDSNFKCAPPAKSKQMGRPCDVHEDCETTDQTGRSGECVCKQWWEFADPKYCDPVTGDYAEHSVNLRNYLFFRAKNCGTFWTEEECLRVFGAQAMRLKLSYECETQELVGGPFLPSADCGIGNDDRFPDYCARLTALGG